MSNMNSSTKVGNRMTELLNKAQRRLGLSVLTLPEPLTKDHWSEIIEQDTLPTFSRYFPYKIITVIDNTCYKDGYYFLDKNVPEGSIILGVKDIDWNVYRADPRFDRCGVNINFSTYDFISTNYLPEDIAFTQMTADFMSLFNLGIYVDFLPPNKVKLTSVNSSPVSRYRPFPLAIFIQHPSSLFTISPTMMETFEKLAFCDVATFLYQNLKYFDNLETGNGVLDLKLDTLQEWMNKRDEIVQQLDEAHTTTANEDQPMILSV